MSEREQMTPGGLTVEEIHRVVRRWAAPAWCSTDRLAADLHALITEHVRSVLEAERERFEDWRVRERQEAASKAEEIYIGEAAKVRDLAEKLDKAVEGLKRGQVDG